MADRITVVCPCCDTSLVVETRSGEILSEERPKKDLTQTFEDAMHHVQGGSKRREEAFEKAFDRTQHQADLLDKKFEEAQKKAKQDKSKPASPVDLD
jgi:hypothetical protein